MSIGLTGRLARASARRPYLTLVVWAGVLVVGMYFAGTIDKYVTADVVTYVTSDSDEGTALDEAYRSASDGSEVFHETVIVTSEYRRGSATPPSRSARRHCGVATLGGIEGVTARHRARDLGDPTPSPTPATPRCVTFETVADANVVGERGRCRRRDRGRRRRPCWCSGRSRRSSPPPTSRTPTRARGVLRAASPRWSFSSSCLGRLPRRGLPLAVAILSIVVALGTASLVGRVFELSDGLLTMTSMLGLALGIDYSLVSVQRFREELAKGHTVKDAVAVAGSTANRAVLLSGLTVVISLAGLALIPTNMTLGIALGVTFVAIASVSAALTLLPAVLRLLGHRVNKGRVPTAHPGQESPTWQRIARTVVRRRGVSAAVGLGVLVALAVPALSIRFANPGPDSLPEGFESRARPPRCSSPTSAGASPPRRSRSRGPPAPRPRSRPSPPPSRPTPRSPTPPWTTVATSRSSTPTTSTTPATAGRTKRSTAFALRSSRTPSRARERSAT